MREINNIILQLRGMFLTCCAVVFIVGGAKANTIKFNPTVRKQEVIMIGADLERCQSYLQTASNVDELIKLGFVDLPFNVCRVSYDKKQELVEGRKNFGFYSKAIKSMQMIKAKSPKIEFWATMKSDYNGYGGENNLPDWICDDRPNTRFDCKKYALFLADYLELMQKSGVGITYMSTSKEWTQTISAERARQIILYLNEECARRGVVQPKYIDAATWSTAQGERYVNAIAKLDMVDLYYGTSTHNYGSSGKYEYRTFVELSSQLGLPAFSDETSFGSGGRTYGKDPASVASSLGSYRNRCALFEAGMVGEVLFEIYSRGVDAESRAIYIPSTGSHVGYPMRSYYIGKEYVTAMSSGNGGYKSYTPYDYSELADGEGVWTMSFVDDKELFVCVLNSSDEAKSGLRLEVEGVSCGPRAIYHYFADELPREGVRSRLGVTDGVVELDMAAHSIHFVRIRIK